MYFEDWYKELVSLYEEVQKGTVKEEEEKDRVAKLTVLEELKPKLDAIDKVAETPEELLPHIYDKHPPICTEHKLVSDFKSDLKKALKKALIHYHPDKIKEEEYGKKRKVLCEEICKRINSHYEALKRE